MPKTVTFLHTSPVHVATFDQLLMAIDPHVPVRHLVDEALLRDARAEGTVTPQLARRVHVIVRQALTTDAAVVVCTCSTLGGCAEQFSDGAARLVIGLIDQWQNER